MTPLERKQVRRAAEMIADEKATLCCWALLCCGFDFTAEIQVSFSNFCQPRDLCRGEWFNDVEEFPARQLARSIALLLFAELLPSEMP